MTAHAMHDKSCCDSISSCIKCRVQQHGQHLEAQKSPFETTTSGVLHEYNDMRLDQTTAWCLEAVCCRVAITGVAGMQQMTERQVAKSIL